MHNNLHQSGQVKYCCMHELIVTNSENEHKRAELLHVATMILLGDGDCLSCVCIHVQRT